MRYCTLYVYLYDTRKAAASAANRPTKSISKHDYIRTLDQTGNTPCTCAWKTWLVIRIHQTQI